MTSEARHLQLLCPFNLFKLVCIHAIPNKARMLQLKLMKFRFWNRKKKQLNIDIVKWANTAVERRKKKVSNLNGRMFLKSKKNKNSFFLELGRKKKHINTDISFLQKRIKVKFFFRLWQSSHVETYSGFVLNAWLLRKKSRKKKPFCSKVCLCIQTFSTWYCRKTFPKANCN